MSDRTSVESFNAFARIERGLRNWYNSLVRQRFLTVLLFYMGSRGLSALLLQPFIQTHEPQAGRLVLYLDLGVWIIFLVTLWTMMASYLWSSIDGLRRIERTDRPAQYLFVLKRAAMVFALGYLTWCASAWATSYATDMSLDQFGRYVFLGLAAVALFFVGIVVLALLGDLLEGRLKIEIRIVRPHDRGVDHSQGAQS